MSRSKFTAQTAFLIAAFFALIGSAAFHWAVQSTMTSNTTMAATMTALFVLAPPIFVGFLFPRSPIGMLLLKTQLPTWGGIVLAASACFMVGYDFVLTWNWWLLPGQHVVAEAGYAGMQSVLAMFGFHVLPGLLLVPASTPEAMQAMHQAHVVKRYALQTQAELALLRHTSVQAQALAARGWADLNDQERRFLAGAFHGLVHGIDQTLADITASVKTVAGAAIPYRSLVDRAEVQQSFAQVKQALLPDSRTGEPSSGPPARIPTGEAGARPAAQRATARPNDRPRQDGQPREGAKRPEGSGSAARGPEGDRGAERRSASGAAARPATGGPAGHGARGAAPAERDRPRQAERQPVEDDDLDQMSDAQDQMSMEDILRLVDPTR